MRKTYKHFEKQLDKIKKYLVSEMSVYDGDLDLYAIYNSNVGHNGLDTAAFIYNQYKTINNLPMLVWEYNLTKSLKGKSVFYDYVSLLDDKSSYLIIQINLNAEGNVGSLGRLVISFSEENIGIYKFKSFIYDPLLVHIFLQSYLELHEKNEEYQ